MTAIQWTDETWNPVTGCSKVSAGCKNCYAEALAPKVFAGQTVETHPSPFPDHGVLRPRRFTDVRCHPDRLEKPLHWRKPRRVFVNSMSDLFHEDVPDEFIDQVFAVMALSPQHTFQVLTKRPERMREFLASPDYGVVRKLRHRINAAANAMSEPPDNDYAWNAGWPLPNVWLGVSAEDQTTADERIPILLDTPAAVRFVSAEPLLGPADLMVWENKGHDLPSIDWAIVGGESGRKARPCNVAWVRSIRDQCAAAKVPLFVKQFGANVLDRNDAGWQGEREDEWPMDTESEGNIHGYREDYQGAPVRVCLRHPKGGDMAEWPEDLRVREWPETKVSTR